MARVARAHGVNANQVFGWRRLYRAGRLGEQMPGSKLLPVRVSDRKSAPVVVEHGVADCSQTQAGTIHIELRCSPRFGSRAMQIPSWCGCCWSVCGHDRVAGEDTDLDCSGGDRLAPRLHYNVLELFRPFTAVTRVQEPSRTPSLSRILAGTKLTKLLFYG